MDIGELYANGRLKPDDLDFVETYDDYPVISMMQFEDLGFCPQGGRADFVRQHDFTIGGSFPHNNLGRPIVGRAGRGGRRLSWACRGAAPGARTRGQRRSRMRVSARVGLWNDQL